MKNPQKNQKILNIVLAVVLAMGLWLYVTNVENPTSTITVRDIPITLVEESTLSDQGLMITEQSRDSVSLKLSARKKTLMRLSRRNISLELDVSEITEPGEYTLSCQPVYPTNVNTDSVTVADWENLRVTIVVEKEAIKTIPVQGEFIGTEAEHWQAGTVTVDPAVIQLRGPEEVLKGISYAQASVGGNEISETIVTDASVVFMGTDDTPADRKGVIASTETVKVVVPVHKVVALPLTVELEPGGGAQAEDVEVSITPQTVTVVAADDQDSLPESISLGTIRLEDVMADTSYSMPITLPRGVTAWGETGYASVRLTVTGLATRQIPVSDIQLQNLPQGTQAHLASEKLYVWVRGEEALVSQLTAQQIQVEVDLSQAADQSTLQRLPAKVTLKGEGLEGVGILGSHYSVAFRLEKQ